MIRRITGIILGGSAFLIVSRSISGLATPPRPTAGLASPSSAWSITLIAIRSCSPDRRRAPAAPPPERPRPRGPQARGRGGRIPRPPDPGQRVCPPGLLGLRSGHDARRASHSPGTAVRDTQPDAGCSGGRWIVSARRSSGVQPAAEHELLIAPRRTRAIEGRRLRRRRPRPCHVAFVVLLGTVPSTHSQASRVGSSAPVFGRPSRSQLLSSVPPPAREHAITSTRWLLAEDLTSHTVASPVRAR